MNWKQRLRDMMLAGGTLTAAACSAPNNDATSVNFCGNHNPDPCICGRPDTSPAMKMLCDQKLTCEMLGGEWWYVGPPCMCASGETEPMLVAACDQKKACEAQGGDPFWDDHQNAPDSGLPAGVGCDFPAGSRPADASASGAGRSGDGTD